MRDFFGILGDDREASRNLITEGRRRGAWSQEQSEEEERSMLATEDAACLVAWDLEVLFKAWLLTTLRAYRFLNTDYSETRKAVKEGGWLVTKKELSGLNKAGRNKIS